WRKVMREHTLSTQFYHPVGSKTSAQHLQDFGGINSCLRAEHQRLAHRFNDQGNDNLITGFDYLACPTPSHMHNRLAHCLKDRHTTLERILVPAYHNGERASASSLVSTAHWGVKHGYAVCS